MPRHIGTCFRFYTQMRVEKKPKAFAYRVPIGDYNYLQCRYSFIKGTHKKSHLYELQQTFHKSKKANYCVVFSASNYLWIFLPHCIATKKGYSPIPCVRTYCKRMQPKLRPT